MRRLTPTQWSAWRLASRQLRQFSDVGPATAAAITEEELPEVPVEVAAMVRRRNLSTVEVPRSLTDAVEASARGSRSTKLQRLEALQLTDSLKQMSRTPGKGGTTMSLDAANAVSATAKRGKRKKAQPVKQTLRDLRQSPPVMMFTETIDADDESTDEEGFLEKDAAQQDNLRDAFGAELSDVREPSAALSPEYDSTKVAAYVSSRMPACYAVLYRVFDELHLHLPSFHPRTMLDFGSGPGTAIWAAREVWEEYPQRVMAIEPSDAMVKLATSLQHAQRAQQAQQAQHTSSPCSIQWHRHLHPSLTNPKRSKLPQSGRQVYDLVVASYVLTEMQSDAERRQAVDMLWRQTKDMLVLVEPGTPSGSAFVRHARTQVLDGAVPNARHAQAGRLGPGTGAGAHVVAPCPHDGQCPMEGSRSWCHFAQRFQRSDLQRRHKVLPGGQGARTYQDERFSYVVLRRGPRPGAHTIPDLTIARQRQVDPPDAVQKAIEAGLIPRSPSQLPTQQSQSPGGSMLYDSEEEQEEEEKDSDKAAWNAMNLAGMDDRSRQIILDSIRASAASDEEEDEEQLRQMLTEPTAAEAATAAANTAAVGDQPEEATILETSDDDESDVHAVKPPLVKLPPKKVDAESLKDYDQWDQEFWHNKEPEAVDATLAAAQVWSRIIRKPRKRGKHIIVDVCSPSRHPENAEAINTSQGHLVRQVVATNDKRTWLGPGGYRLARKSRWGDLWPKYYQDYALTHSTSD